MKSFGSISVRVLGKWSFTYAYHKPELYQRMVSFSIHLINELQYWEIKPSLDWLKNDLKRFVEGKQPLRGCV